MPPKKFKLTYFNLRGRGEPIRMLFAAANVDYVDERIEFANWPALKPKTPFGAMPLLDVNGKVMAETIPISRYLAREFGLDGKTNEEKWLSDVVVDFCTEMKNFMIKMHFEKDEAKKEELTKQFKEVLAPTNLGRLEKYLADNKAGNGFIVGNQLTWADIFVIDLLAMLMDGQPDTLAKCPLLKSSKTKIEGLPRIAAWIKKRPAQ